jgi:hypothetical protein
MSMMVISFKGAVDGPDGPFVICNRTTWSSVLEWITALPGSFRGLKALMASGSTKNTESLGTEIGTAMQEHAPSHAVQAALKNILEFMVVGDSLETVIIEEE